MFIERVAFCRVYWYLYPTAEVLEQDSGSMGGSSSVG